MARKVEISEAVGIRNGVRPCPNRQSDLEKIRDLFDAIPTDAGGTRDSIGTWAAVRQVLIAEIAAQITIFQGAQPGLTVDGAIDKSGSTLKRMNAIAAAQGGVTMITATVSHDVAPYSETGSDISFTAIDSFTMPGRGPLKIIRDRWSYVRRLVRVENCSIKWFGVLFNAPGGTAQFGSVPHIYFTPHPSQGHYYDPGYDSFTTWRKLWHDYTQAPGRQIVTAGKDQVLVVPFYTNAQHRGGLGDFLQNWQETVSTVVTVAIDSVDATALRGRFEFNEIYSSSFSDGWIPHRQFQTEGSGVQQMTTRIIDLDGQAAHPPSHWRPAKSIVYLDQPPPRQGNPVGNLWYVGQRWSRQIMMDDWGGAFSGHAACSSYLLYHGMRLP
ncbi:hypothetical protein [Reyranella soli]|uniref:Uncharacterized protein n=1 Tax=Reyranella soli TaxID=1230389 RepID=A0A512NDF2_9HYPH|nr:hypothetical protein [Reyranella soli]GEP56980.1 hypothetical protein RSO01_41460 [Reyranella soli]